MWLLGQKEPYGCQDKKDQVVVKAEWTMWLLQGKGAN